jgi:hypothetical protein
MEHPPHYPNSAPKYFWLFPKIKSALKWKIFQDIEDIRTEMWRRPVSCRMCVYICVCVCVCVGV